MVTTFLYLGGALRNQTQLHSELHSMRPHQKTLISTVYSATADGQWPNLTSAFEEWKASITSVRGELDRKKKTRAADIAKAIGCDIAEADLHRFIFSVERYLENRAVTLLEMALGRPLEEPDLPQYLRKAVGDAREVRALFETLPESTRAQERIEATLVFEALASGPYTDIFQTEFQNLVPRQVRHALGQFYTPPWLARHVLRTSGFRWEDVTSLEQTICDPACGSGVFLMAAAEEIRQAVIAGVLSPHQGQQLIASKLHGIDIEALPALLTCANLTLASSALAALDGRHGADLVLSVANQDSLDFRGPTDVDLVVGNPPWTNWEYMPAEFRAKHVNLWPELGIFKKSGNLAHSKEDISALFVAHAIHFRIKPKGRFGFVLPESLVKSAKNHVGFRKFRVGLMPEPYRLTLAEDFVAVKPFEGVANRTITLYGVKGAETEYPLPFHKWDTLDKKNQAISGSEPLNGDMTVLSARSSSLRDETSSWSTGHEDASIIHRVLDGPNAYQGRTGLFTGGANGVFHLDHVGTADGNVVVQNIVERAKRIVPQVQATIEPTFVYPFLRGRDVQQWRYQPAVRVLLPHTATTRMRPVDEVTMKETAPATYEYLSQFRDILDERRGFSKWEQAFLESGFYACQRVGDYTFADWKVVWRYISSRFTTAVIGPDHSAAFGTKPVVPNEKLMLIACGSEMEAYYLGGVLASAPVISHVHSRMVSTQIPPSIVQNISVPLFDPRNETHAEISRLCSKGHEDMAKGDMGSVLATIDAVDLAAASLWSLKPSDVRAVRSEIGY